MDVVMGVNAADAAKLVALVTLYRELGSEDVALAIDALTLWWLPRHGAQAVALLIHQEAESIA
jgi:hypothetical protein